jgi:hypothetical protein
MLRRDLDVPSSPNFDQEVLQQIHCKSISIQAIIYPTSSPSTSIRFWVLNCERVGGMGKGEIAEN